MRFYNKDGIENIPSVTTIIQILGSSSLMKWSNIMGFKHKNIDNILEDSANFGNAAHEIARKCIDSLAPDPNPPVGIGFRISELNELTNTLQKFLIKNPIVPKFTEHTMISTKLGYGGTCDAFGDLIIDGKEYKNHIIDWKTAKNVHNNMWLQTGGYRNLLLEENIIPEGSCIIRLSNKKINVDLIDKSTLDNMGNAFNILNDFYKLWKDNIS